MAFANKAASQGNAASSSGATKNNSHHLSEKDLLRQVCSNHTRDMLVTSAKQIKDVVVASP